MRNARRLRRKILFGFSLWGLALLLPFLVFGAESTYQISELELIQLESNLNKLREINQTSQMELSELKNDLVLSREELKQAKIELTGLQEELTLLTRKSEMQQKSLQTANEYLNQYANEVKNKEKTLKKQRNLAYLACALITYLTITK